MPKILLFDIDGTLLLTGGAGGDALRESLQIEFQIENPLKVPLHGRTDFGIIQELLQANQLEVSPEHIERIKNRYFQILPNVLAQREGRILAGVPELLEHLGQSQRYACSLLTGNMAKSALMKLRHYQLHHHFRGGVFGDAHADRRHLGRDALVQLSEQFQAPLTPQDVVIIGDTTLDIACARAIGCPVLAVATGMDSKSTLEQHGADQVVEHLSDLPQILNWFDQVLSPRSPV